MFIIGLVILIVGLMISVALHELGHMLPAKKFGALVPEYWIGFGPTVWKTKNGDTTYGVKALPLGGYVRILGMYSPEGSGPKTKANGTPTLAEMARQQSGAELAEAARQGQSGQPFYRLSTPKKLVVMAGGPVMNLLIAIVLIAVVIMGIGFSAPSTTIAEVRNGEDGSASPAVSAGIEPGDQIIQWDGEPVESWELLTEAIQATDGPVDVVVKRGGTPVTLVVEPARGEDGAQYVGIVSAVERQRGTPADVVESVWMQVSATGRAIIALPVSLFDLVKSLFTGEERDSSGVISVVGVARLAGDITGAPAAANGDASPGTGIPGGMSFLDRAALMLSLLAALNVALFVFNLIPLPPLDGGHVAGALWGGARNMGAKMTGKPRPAPADTARMVPLSYGVFVVLMVMTVILVVADLVKPITFA